MDLIDVIRICARRWYVLLPLVLASAGLAYQAYSQAKPVYYTNAVVGLAPPNNRTWQLPDGTPTPVNGLLEGGGPNLIANLTILGLKDAAVTARVVEGGGSPAYGVKMFPVAENAPQVPLIMIETTQPTADLSAKTIELVVGQSSSVLKATQQQAGVGEAQMVKPILAAAPAEPKMGTPSRTKASLGIFLGGFGLSVIVTVLVDIAMSRRRLGKPATPALTTTEQPAGMLHDQAKAQASVDA